jgi:hypothetical protein
MLKNHNVRFAPIPEGVAPPAGPRRRSPFSANYSDTRHILNRELTEIRASAVVIQLDCDERQIRQDGMPKSDCRTRSPRVIISCESKWGPLSYPCDAFNKWEDNLRAIALALQALRLVDRYGVTQTGQQYRGWKAITYRGDDQFPNAQAAAEWFGKLDPVKLPASRLLQNAQAVEDAYRAAAKVYHPDHGGTADKFAQVTAAVEILRGWHQRRLK